MNKLFAILITITLSGCGTMTSLSNSDDKISRNLIKHKSHCETTTRAYGGVSYNLCRLNSNTNNTYIDWFLGWYVFDTVVSAVTDTIVLPYTAYQQADKGNVKVAH